MNATANRFSNTQCKLSVLGSLIVAIIGFPAVASASLVGSTVTGGLFYATSPGVFDTYNFLDPANNNGNGDFNGGVVPVGFGNSSSPTTKIVDPGIEFGLLSGGGTVASPGIFSVTADFTGSTLQIAKNYADSGLAGFEMTFTDPAFAGLTLTKTHDSFQNGGMTANLVGDTLTLVTAPDCIIGPGCGFSVDSQDTATFNLTPVPLPADAWLLLTGLGGLGVFARRRRAPA
jgi:hypothetical protein